MSRSPRDPTAVRELARAETERGELVLRERPGGVLELRANGMFVMDTAEVSSEESLATAVLARVERPASVWVGGLGLGFTLRAVLADPRVEACTVVEIEPDLVAWMRDGTIAHGPTLLADARARPVVADLAVAVLEAAPGSVDLLLLDVDNGPGQLVHAANAALYGTAFLRTARGLLRPGGAVAVWSAATAPELVLTLAEVFDDVEEIGLEVDLQGRDETYWLYLARRPLDAVRTGSDSHR